MKYFSLTHKNYTCIFIIHSVFWNTDSSSFKIYFLRFLWLEHLKPTLLQIFKLWYIVLTLNTSYTTDLQSLTEFRVFYLPVLNNHHFSGFPPVRLFFLFKIPHVSEIMWHVSCCACLVSWNIMHSRLIYVLNNMISFVRTK